MRTYVVANCGMKKDVEVNVLDKIIILQEISYMKNRFWLMTCMFFISLIFSCKVQSEEDKLAIKLSQSLSYNELMRSSSQMAEQVKKYKADTALTAKYKNLDSIQKRDSMLKYLFRIDSFQNMSIKLSEASIKMNKEFPEFAKLTPESRKIVFKKATALWTKANNIK